jgi:hypothetical protein
MGAISGLVEKIALSVWKVGLTVTALDGNREFCVDGKYVPCTKVSSGYISVHGYSMDNARQNAKEVARKMFIDVTNAEVFNSNECTQSVLNGFRGLRRAY